MTIGKRIICGFAVAVVITAGLGVFAFSRFGEVQSRAETIEKDCIPGLDYAGRIEIIMTRNFGRMFQAIVENDPAEIEKLNAAMAAASKEQEGSMDAYEKSITQQQDRELFAKIDPLRTAYSASRQRVMALVKDKKNQEAVALVHSETDPAFQQYATAVRALGAFNRSRAARRAVALTETV